MIGWGVWWDLAIDNSFLDIEVSSWGTTIVAVVFAARGTLFLY